MKKQNELDKAFQQAFEGFKPDVPENSWTQVKNGIDNMKLQEAVLLKNRFRNLSILLSALLLGLTGLYLQSSFNNPPAESLETRNNDAKLRNEQMIPSLHSADTVIKYNEILKVDTVYLTRTLVKPLDSEYLTKALEDPTWREQILGYLNSQEVGESLAEKELDKEEIGEQHSEPTFDYLPPTELNTMMAGLLNVRQPKGEIYPLKKNKSRQKALKERIPLKDRMFYQILGSGTTGKLIVQNSQTGFGRNHGYDFGAFAGARIGKRFWMKTGLKFDVLEYALSPFGRVQLPSEQINNEYQYVYRSPLGNLIIPNSELSNAATQGSTIEIESHNDNRSKQLIVPLQLNYDFVKKDVKFLGYYRPLELYGGLSAYFQKPLKNSVSLEIYESEGNEFELSLNSFTSVSNLSVGGALQAGMKLEVYPGWKLMTELSGQRNLTYYVNNEYFRSFQRGLSFSGGLEIKLK